MSILLLRRARKKVTEMTLKACQPAATHTAKALFSSPILQTFSDQRAFEPTVFKRVPFNSMCFCAAPRARCDISVCKHLFSVRLAASPARERPSLRAKDSLCGLSSCRPLWDHRKESLESCLNSLNDSSCVHSCCQCHISTQTLPSGVLQCAR